MAREKLVCEEGPHNWTRVPTRGRKPTRCPKHPRETTPKKPPEKPVAARKPRVVTRPKANVPAKPRILPSGREKLTCEIGPHTWTRKPTRGRKPTTCEKHRNSAKIQSSTQETLLCQVDGGSHNWTRDIGHGRKPKHCPEHTPERPAPASSVETTLPSPDEVSDVTDVKPDVLAQRRRKAEERIENLELMLKARGQHISQHQ